MTQKELYQVLKNTGIPVAYHHFSSPQCPPYIVYFRENTENIGADNAVWHKVENYIIELYTQKKDLVLEQRLESVFDQNKIFYDVYESWIEEEKVFKVSCEIQI